MAQRNITTLSGSPAELQVILNRTTLQDQNTNAQLKKYGTIGGVAGVIAFLGFFLCIFISMEAELSTSLVLWGIEAALIVLAIWAGIRHSKWKAVDLDDEKLEMARNLLSSLEPDLSPKSPLTMEIRHGDLFDWGRTLSETKGTLFSASGSTSEHEDSWFSLRAKLTDGSVLKVGVTRSGKRKKRPKRKYTKIKDRMRDKVSLALRVDPQKYPHLDRLEPSLRPERLRGRTFLHPTPARVTGSVVHLNAVSEIFMRQVLRRSRPETGMQNRVDGEKLVSLLAYVMAGLSHCRAENPPPAAPAPQP